MLQGVILLNSEILSISVFPEMSAYPLTASIDLQIIEPIPRWLGLIRNYLGIVTRRAETSGDDSPRVCRASALIFPIASRLFFLVYGLSEEERVKIGAIVRVAALLLLGGVLLVWATTLAAADPAGDSPSNGIPVGAATTETCVSQTLAPGAQIWFKVSYHAGTDLELRSKSANGVTFAVYDPQKASSYPSLPDPTGLLTPNSNEPGTTSTWQGHLAQGNASDFYYVLVTNTNTFPVTFSFCTIEKQLFTPPAQTGGAPTFTLRDTCAPGTTSASFFTDETVFVSTYTTFPCGD